MAYATTHTHNHGLNLGDRISALVSAYKAGAARRRVYRQTVAELQGLSDLDLADLGIYRCDIHHVALDAANSK